MSIIKMKEPEEAEPNITSLIDCLMQCIIFFMMIMSAQYIYGVAIKFPSVGAATKQTEQKKEKDITVYVQSDQIEQDHRLVREGIIKVNGEEVWLGEPTDSATYAHQKEQAYLWVKAKIYDLVEKQGYKKDLIKIQGDMKTYHGKIMKVIDISKECHIDGFSLVPPTS